MGEPNIAAPSKTDLENQPPAIQIAMRSSVVILTGQSLGSGVVVQRKGATSCLVLTNRHVVDNVFADSYGQKQLSASQIPNAKVKFVTGDDRTGKVVWLAGEVDLAIVKVDCPKGVEVVDWQESPNVVVGDEVFAIGSPSGLGWTYTKGTISAFREQDYGPKKVPVVQTDTRIGPGNSGGGLFSKKGVLIGINTYVVSSARDAGETGLGFAIRKTLLSDLKPEMLKAAAAREVSQQTT